MAGGANPAMTQAASNPYQQAAGAQQAAMGRVGQGMYQTAAGGMGAYQNPYEQAVVDKSPIVASAALVSGLRLMKVLLIVSKYP